VTRSLLNKSIRNVILKKQKSKRKTGVFLNPRACQKLAAAARRANPDSIAAKARVAGFVDRHTVYERMRRYECSAEEAIAMGTHPIRAGHRASRRYFDPLINWVIVEASKIGISEFAARRRLQLGWSVEKTISTAITSQYERSCLGAKSRYPGIIEIPNAAARAAGFNPNTLRHRMRLHSCSLAEAIAMGPPRYYQIKSLATKARAAAIHVSTLQKRMKNNSCSVDEAIAMGPARDRTKSIATKARAAGRNPNTVRDRIRRGWSLRRALSTPPLR
jgi:hypothetical protein